MKCSICDTSCEGHYNSRTKKFDALCNQCLEAIDATGRDYEALDNRHQNSYTVDEQFDGADKDV